MKTKLFELWLAAAAVGLLAAGCETPEGTPNRTATGALIGGGIGAASGALIGGGRHGAEGALIGGALGAVTGGLIGHSMDKAMAKAGVGDEVIISQIRSTHTIYRLSAADIIDLHNSGESQKVMDFMINTAS